MEKSFLLRGLVFKPLTGNGREGELIVFTSKCAMFFKLWKIHNKSYLWGWVRYYGSKKASRHSSKCLKYLHQFNIHIGMGWRA